MKKITLMLSIFLGAVCLLAGCGNPYARMKLTVSDKEVVLYLDTDEEGQRVTTSSSVDVTISGAKKGVSTDIVVVNSLENIVSISTSKSGSTTKVTFTPNENAIGNSADIVVRSKEGGLSDTIRVTLYEKVKEIEFVHSPLAVADGGSIMLGDYLTYTPTNTNQKGVEYTIKQEDGFDQIQEYISLTSVGLLSAKEGTVTNDGSTVLPFDEEKGLYYVTVSIQSQFDSEIVAEKKVYVVPTIKATDVSVRSGSSSGKVILSSELTNVTVQENGNWITLTQVPTFSVVLANNVNANAEFLYSRTLEFILDATSNRRDSMYTVSLMQQKYMQSDRNFVHVSQLTRNSLPNDQYEYNTFRLDQVAIGQDVLVFKIEYTNFEGMLTTYIALDVKVQNFATDIVATIAGEQISTITDDGTKDDYKTINVLNSLTNQLSSYTCVTLATNYDRQNKNIKLSLNLEPSDDFDNALWEETKKHIFACDKEGNPIALDGSSSVENASNVYLYHDLTPAQVQYAKNRIHLTVRTVYDLNPVADSEEMKFPHEVVQSFPMTIHSNMIEEDVEIANNVLLSVVSQEEQTLLTTQPGVYATNFVIGTDRRNTKVVRNLVEDGRIVSSVYVDNKLLFEVIQQDDMTGGANKITLKANNNVLTGSTYLTLKDSVHGWDFLVKVEVYAPLAYQKEGEASYFASRIPNENAYKGQWITSSKKELVFDLGGKQRKEQSIQRLKLATTTARDKNSLQTYVPIEVYNVVNVNGQIFEIDLLSSARISPSSSRYFYYEKGKIYPFNNQYINEDSPLTLSFIVDGYDSFGQAQSVTYTIELLFVDIVEKVELIANRSVIYEKSSLGIFDEQASMDTLGIRCTPHATNDMTTRYAYVDALLRRYTVGNENIDIMVSDLILLHEDTGELVVDYTRTPYGTSKIAKLQTLFGSVGNVLQNIFSSPISVKVEVFAKQEQLDSLYDTTFVMIDYAQKVQYIYTSNLDEQGIYLETTGQNENAAKYASKTIALSVLPNEAYNKTLRIVFADGADRSMIRFAAGQVDSEGRIISSNAQLTFYPEHAGEMTVYIAAEDSFKQDAVIAGKYNPDTVIAIRVKVADGSKAYPFEIADYTDFMNIGNGYVQGVNSYHYMLSNNIDLSRTVQSTSTLFAGTFNGSLSGLMRYDAEHAVQKTISGYKVNVEQTQTNSTLYGLFERVGKEGVLSHLILSNVDVAYSLTATQEVTIGTLAGVVEGRIDCSSISGKVTVQNHSTSNNQLTIGGVVGRLNGQATSANTSHGNVVTNYSILLDLTVKNAVVGGLAGSVQGEVNGQNGFVHVQNSNAQENTNLMVGGLAGFAEQTELFSNTIQVVLAGDEVGGLVGRAERTTIDHNFVELLDSLDTKASYGIYGTKLVGGLVGRVSHTTISYSYVRSYNKGADNYLGDIVLSGTKGQVIGGLVAKHEDVSSTLEDGKTTITNSYFDGGLSIDGENNTSSVAIGSLVGTSGYYQNDIYQENNHVFIQNAYAKVNNQSTLPFIGNYQGVSSLLNIHKIGISGVKEYTFTTTITQVNTSTDETTTFEPDIKENQTIGAYELPDSLVTKLKENKEEYSYYSASKKLENIREVREYNDGTHPYLLSMTEGNAFIQFEELSNNQNAYYIYQEEGTEKFYAFPSFVELDGVTYEVGVDDKYVPVFNLPRQAIVPGSEEDDTKEEYVDGIVTSYSFDKDSVTTIYSYNGQKVTYTNPVTYEDFVGVSGQEGLWPNGQEIKRLAHRGDVYFEENGTGYIDWELLNLYTYYLEDDMSGRFALNNNLPILVDKGNSKLLYNILPTSLTIQVSNEEVSMNSNHYFFTYGKTAIIYYNVLQSQGTVPSGNNEYFVGLTQEGVSIATYTLSVNEDFGGDTRVSVISSNPQVVRVAENNKIVICGIGESTITVRSLLDRNVFDTFTIVTTYGIRGLSLFDVNNQIVESVDAVDISQQNPSIIEYIKEYYSYYSLLATNTVDMANTGRKYTYQTETNYKLQVTINGYAKASNSEEYPSMVFAGKTVKVSGEEILIDENPSTTFTIDNIEQLAIRATSEGRFSFTLTPVITVQGNEYALEEVSKQYLIQLANKAQSITFNKGATGTSFALSGSGSSSELGVDFVTYNEKENLYMQVLNYKGDVLGGSVAVNSFTGDSFAYLSMKLTNTSVTPDSKTNAKTLHYHFELTFDEEKYLQNILSDDEKDSLNHQQYTLVFTCESNEQLSKEFAIDMHALPVSEMTSYFYPSAQNKNGAYYPQETASNYLVPNRIGLIKSNVYPLLNDIDYFEYTVSPAYREYIRLTQYYDKGEGFEAYPNTQYLPDFAGIRLQKISSLQTTTSTYAYNGNYYVGVTTSANCPAGGKVELQLTGYKIINGQPVAMSEATQSMTLDVVALPKVDVTVDGGKETVLANGYTKQLNLSLTNYSTETDGAVDFTIEKQVSKDSWTREGLQGKYRVNDQYVFETIDGTIGDVVRITATVKKILNGEIESSTSSVIITIVAYEITGIYLQGYTTNTLELLNGTQNYLLGDIAYRGQPTESNLNELRLLKFMWNGALAVSNETNSGYITDGRHNPFLYQSLDQLGNTRYDNVTLNTSLYNSSIKLARSNSNNYIYVETQKVTNNLPFRLNLRYYYNDKGIPTLYYKGQNNDVYKDLYYDFTITIKENSTYDRPTPIFSTEDFYNLGDYNEGHYILMNNLTLDKHIPFNLNINSLDGNGHVITINGFDLNNYQDGNSANVGLFDTIGENTIVKNITIDVQPLLTDINTIQVVLGKKTSTVQDYEKALDDVKLNFGGIATVRFGLVAVTNNGTLTNIKVVNFAESKDKNYLFVYSTQDFLSGNRADASIAGLVYENGTSGVITNSFVGMNYAEDGKVTVNMAAYSTTDQTDAVNGNDMESIQKEEKSTTAFTIAGGKELAGLVATNSGIVASSYVYGVGLLNIASLASEVYTGGVAVFNRGTIFASFIEGLSDSGNELRANNEYIIESTGLSGGFAYSNSGTIYDCYANIVLSTNSGRTGDFIFTNTGSLRNCYTTAISLTSTSNENQEIRTYHGVFTGIGSDLTINNTGTYSGCYYLYLNGETESKVEHALAINGSGSEEQPSNFTNIDYFYGYSMGASKGSKEYIWGQSVQGPKLNFASYDTTSIRKMIIETSSAEAGWNYMYFAKYSYGTSTNPILISSGEELVTAIINNAVEQKDKSLLFGAEVKTESQEENYAVNTIRLVRNIDVTSTLVNQTMVNNRYLRDVIFAGILDGNGMRITIENLNDELYQKSKVNFGLFSQIGMVTSTVTVQNENSTEGKSSSADVQTRQVMVKNTKFVLRGNVTSTNAQNVGMLAGSIYNATITDVEVSASEGATVSGSNAVGGIAGVIGGGSTLLNVSSNISVSSVYDSGVVNKENSTDLNYEFAYRKYNGTLVGTTIDTKNISYAGGVAGILDITTGKEVLSQALSSSKRAIFDTTDRTSLFITPQSESKIMNLRVYGYVQIVGEHAGGLFGYVGKTSHVKHSTFELDPTTTQRIVGHNYAGGAVAENYGYLEEVYLDASHTASVSLDETLPSTAYGVDLFREENTTALTAIYPTAIGGIAGYNEGAIYNSYSKANVANANAFVAGGVIGITSGVTYLSHVYTTAFVQARRVIGGVIGFVRETKQIVNNEVILTQPTIYLDYVTGYNVWDNVADKTTNNSTYTILYNLYKDYYKDENGRQLSFEVRMPQVGNQQAQAWQSDSATSMINQTFTRTTYLGSFIGRVGRATESSDATTIKDITNIELQNIVKTRLNSEENNGAIYAELNNHIPTNNNTIYTATSAFAIPNSMPNKKADIARKYDTIYYEDMLGIQKPYDVLKNGLEYQLDKDAGYQLETHVQNYPIVTEMVSNNWLVDNNSGQPSIYWYYNPATNLPILIEGVSPADNTIKNGSDYVSKVLLDSLAKLSANKTYSVVGDVSGVEFENSDQASLIFQGSLQGMENDRKTITLRSDQTFNVLRNATISNLTFSIDAKDRNYSHGRTLHTDGHTAYGYFADFVYHSTIRNVNIEVKLPETVTMTGYLNMVNDYYGLIFGYVVDSTIENVTITITTKNGNPITIEGSRYENFGVFAGGIQATKVSNVGTNACAITYQPSSTNSGSLDGYQYDTAITMGSFAGMVSNSTTLSKVTDNVSLTIENVQKDDSVFGYRTIHIGSIGYLQSSYMESYAVTGALTIKATSWVNTNCTVYTGRAVGSSYGSTVTLMNGLGNITYEGNGAKTRLGGVAGQDTNSTFSLQKTTGQSGQIGELNQTISLTTNVQAEVGAVVGRTANSIIKNMIIHSSVTAKIGNGNVGGVVGKASETNLEKVMFDGEVTVTRTDGSSYEIKIGGLFGEESYSYASSFVVMGKLTYASSDNSFALAGLSATTQGASNNRNHYKNGIVSPVLEQSSTIYTLCKNKQIEPLTTSDSDNGRIDKTVRYPYELYLYEGMEELGDISTKDTDKNAMRYVDFIDTYYKTSGIQKDSLQDIFKYEIGESGTRYNPNRISSDHTIDANCEEYFIVEGAHTITFVSTFNGVLIGKNTKNSVATSASSSITNNGVIANIHFSTNDTFGTNNGTLFNVLSTNKTLVGTNNGLIMNASVVVENVELNNKALFVTNNTGTILNSYAIGNITNGSAYALVANNSGTIRNSYYAGNIPTIMSGTTTGNNVSGIYADAYALGKKATIESGITYLSTTDLQKLGDKISGFANNDSLQYNYGYPYIQGGMIVDRGTIREYNIYNQADWVLVMTALQTNKSNENNRNADIRVNIAKDFTFANMSNFTGFDIKGGAPTTEETVTTPHNLVINGNDHTITINESMKNNGNNFGLLSSAEYVTIQKLTLSWDKSQTLATGTSNAGGLIGTATHVTLDNVRVDNFIVTGSANKLGGVIGQGTNVTVTNSVTVFNANLRNDNTEGSLGAFAGTVTGLINNGTITLNSPTLGGKATKIGGAIGELSGALNGTITTNANGTITAGSGATVGGLIGQWSNASGTPTLDNSHITITRAANAEGVAANQTGAVGGLVGQLTIGSNFEIVNWTFAKSITNSSNTPTGGLVGQVQKTSRDITLNIAEVSTASGEISSTNGSLGGLIGASNVDVTIGAEIEITNIFNDEANSIGGLIGTLTGSLTVNSNITISKNITGKTNVGGLVGQLEGSLRLNDKTISIPTTITSTQGNAGGLVGTLNGYAEVTALTLTAEDAITVTGNTNAGGLVGAYNVTTYKTIDVSAFGQTVNISATTHYAGGLVGQVTSSNNMTYGISATALTLGTIQTKGEGYSAGGLVGYSETDVELGSIIMNNLANFKVNSELYGGGLIGHVNREKHVTITGNITFGPESVLERNLISGVNYSGGLFGYVGYLTLNSGKSITIQNLTMNTPKFTTDRGFGMVVGYAHQLTNDGTITIKNVHLTTTTSNTGLVIGHSIYRTQSGTIIISNSQLRTEEKKSFLGLVAGSGSIESASVELINSQLIVPNIEAEDKSFNFEKSYSTNDLFSMIGKEIGNDYSKLWIQNGKNETLNDYHDRWFGKLSGDTRSEPYVISGMPFHMAWGHDDTIIVSTSKNFNNSGTNDVSAKDYFETLNINATFDPNPRSASSYAYGLITGSGSIYDTTPTIDDNSKILNSTGNHVKIGSFLKMMFNYMEEQSWGCSKWLVMEFSYYLDAKQLTNNTSYKFVDDFISHDSSVRNRIEVKFANSYVGLGNDEKPKGGESNIFHYLQPKYRLSSNGAYYSRYTEEKNYAHVTATFFTDNTQINNAIPNQTEDRSGWSWHELIFTKTRIGALSRFQDGRDGYGIIQQCMGNGEQGQDDGMGWYPAV